jgi:hypothetical protein
MTGSTISDADPGDLVSSSTEVDKKLRALILGLVDHLINEDERVTLTF